MAVSSKLRSFQANLGPLFCLFCLGQDKICNPYAGTHSPNYLLDKDLIVWGHHKYQSFHVNLTKILLKLGIIVKNRGK